LHKSAKSRLAVLLVVVLIGASCGDDGDDAGGGAGGGSAVEAGKAPGVTDDSIKIGVTYPDLEAIKDVIVLDYGDYEATFQALFDDINENGGINGRKLVPVYAAVNPIGTESAADVCKKLTEEDEVFVTIGLFLGESVLCHVEEHESAVIGGTMTPELLAKAKAPWFTTDPSVDLQIDAIREFDEAELFDGKFAVMAQVADEVFLHEQAEPALEEFGLAPVDVAILQSPQGDEAAIEEAKVAAERFEAAGVTKVLVLGQAGITFASGLERIGYRPQILFAGSTAITSWLNDAAGHDLAVLDGSVAADVYGGRVNQFREPNMQLCVAGPLKAHGIDIPEPTDGPVPPGTADPFSSALAACKAVALLEGLLSTVPDALGYDTFRAAAEEMGDLPMPSSERPYRYGAPPHADGDAPLSLFDFDPAKKTFIRRDS
jgi:ABC-type branched-subunit amino acid transport system substrate-binding protein